MMQNKLQTQNDELYAIEAIYLDDFEYLRNIHPYLFSVIVRPFVPVDFFNHQSMHIARINIELPVDYPHKVQRFWYEIEGVSNHFSRELILKANSVCDQVIQQYESIDDKGQFIIFAVVEALRQWLFDKSQYEQDRFDNVNKTGDDNQFYIPNMPKFQTFTQVTMETFTEWKKKFDQELYELKRKSKQFELDQQLKQKQSGKSYFEEKQQHVDDIVDDDDDVEELDAEEIKHINDNEEDSDEDYQPLYEREQIE